MLSEEDSLNNTDDHITTDVPVEQEKQGDLDEVIPT